MVFARIKDYCILLVDIVYFFFVTFVADIFGWQVSPGGINYSPGSGSSSGGGTRWGGGARVGGGGAPRNLRGLGTNVSYRGGAGGG